MKKTIALLLTLVMCLVSLTSCTGIFAGAILLWGLSAEPSMVAENSFFDNEYLVECKLEDIPVPNVDGSFRTETKLYLNLTEEEFDAYAKQVFDYLLAKEDAYFKGYLAEVGCHGGIFFLVEDRYAPLAENYNLDADSHEFIFSTTELLNEGDEYNRNYWNEVVIRIVRSSGTLEKEDFAYNTVIQITNKENNARGSVYMEYYKDPYEE